MAYIKLKDPTAFIIKKQVIRVENLIGQKNKFKEVTFNKKINLTKNLRREETEESLEKYKDIGSGSSGVKGFSTPRLGFLDSVKNFLFSVLFGSLALKLLPHLPQLKGVLITTLKIGNFAIEFAGTILNAMVTFVDKVYGIIDFGKKQAKILGGDSGLKNYENMLGMTSKVMNYVLIAGMLFSDLIVIKAQADSNQNSIGEIGETIAGEIKKRQGFRAAIQTAGRTIGGIAKAAGVVLLVGLASSLLGELMFQQRKFTKKLQNDVAYQLKEAKSDPNPITKALKLIAYNAALPGLKFFNFVSTGVGTLLDIIGAPFRYLGELVNLGIMSLTGDVDGIRKQRENLGKLDARIREQIREIVNTLSLGTLAKEKGSFGSLYGSSSTTAMGYASGGSVTREGVEAIGGAITRSGDTKAIYRTFEIPMSPLNPGSDVGGKVYYVDPDTKKPTKSSNIETFFPNPEDPKYINSYEYLTGSYNLVSSGYFLKPFLEMPIKIIMGNGSSEGDYSSLAASVSNLFVTVLKRTLSPETKKSLADEIGFVDIFSWSKNSIRKSMIDPVNELLKSLKEQFMLKSGSGPKKIADALAGDNPDVIKSSPLEEFAGQAKFVIGDSIAHGFAGRSGNGSDFEDTMVGRSPEKVLAYLKSKGDKLSGMLIDLSTGIANNPGDFPSVEAQLSYLKSIGAKVRVLGVANSFSKKNDGINEKLKKTVESNQFYFYGGYKGSADGVHGTPTDYSDLKAKQARDTTATKETEGQSPTGKGYGNQGSKIAGELGRFLDSKGVGNMGSGVHQHPEHPPWLPESGHSVGSLHYASKGARAIDIGGYGRSRGYDDQERILARVSEFNKMKGVRPVQLFKDGDPDHDDHVHVAYKEGGPIYKTDYALTHPGEYVVDADSVKLFGIHFYDIINQTETISQRKNASHSLISILSQYTEDGFPETEDDYSYQVSPPEVKMIPGPVIMIGSSSYGGNRGGGDEDHSQDGLEQR